MSKERETKRGREAGREKEKWMRTGKIGEGNWVQKSVDVDDVAASPEGDGLNYVYVAYGLLLLI